MTFCWLRARSGTLVASRSRDRWYILVVAASIATVAILFREHRDFDAGGAWTPSVRDLGGLVALIVGGVASARVHFLDSDRLVPGWLAAVPLPLWGGVALLLALPAVYGLRKAWADRDRRWIAIAFLICIFCPVIGIWIYAELFDLKVWAYKPFLATAYFVYLWLGAGLAALRIRVIRAGALAAIVAVNLTSIVPFYAEWRRWPLAEPLRSLGDEIGPGEAVLVQEAASSSMVFFYLPDCELVWTLQELPEDSGANGPSAGGGTDGLHLFPVPRSESVRGRIHPTSCQDPRLRDVHGLRYFGDISWLQSTRDRWPSCISELPVQVYGSRRGWHVWRRPETPPTSPSRSSSASGHRPTR
jgi:hypothetical protein